MSEVLENTYVGDVKVLHDGLAAVIIAVPEDYVLDQMKVFDQAVVTDGSSSVVAGQTQDQKVYRFRFKRDVDASDREAALTGEQWAAMTPER